MNDRNDLLTRINVIEGWLTNNEALLLYDLASKCRGKGSIVEIGSWKGKSTVCLGLGSMFGNRTRIFAVDPHDSMGVPNNLKEQNTTFHEFKMNISKNNIESIVVPMVKTSIEASKLFANSSVELIFVDGSHDYESVKLDFKSWFPKVMQGGIIAFHDSASTDWIACKRAVQESITLELFEEINYCDSITYAKKK